MAFREHSDPYETFKEQGRPGGSFADWEKQRGSAATDAPQKALAPAPQVEAPKQREGKGGPGWNEDFDEQWGRRVLENPKLKERFGLSDYSSLRDEETRRQINRWLRNNKGQEEQAAAAPQSAAPAASKSAAAVSKEAGKAGDTGKTTGKTSFTTAKAAGTLPTAPTTSAVLRAGRRPPQGLLYGNTIAAVSGGMIPQLEGPWWPSYPAGNAPPATRSGTASLQAMALQEQG